MHIADSKLIILVLIKFRVRGALRYICHSEMLKIFKRACVRAGIKIQHSQGFNPRPRLSLPLPRPVGIESDDDLLCLRIYKCTGEPVLCSSTATEDVQEQKSISELCTLIKTKLSEQLPEGVELLSVEVPEAKTIPQPHCITYILAVRPEYADDRLKATIKHLSERKHIIVERKIDVTKFKIENRKSRIKEVNVRPFLKSIELDDRSIAVECAFTSAGSIRVEEILNLLEIDEEKLTAPIKRTNVQWQKV